MRKQLVRYKKRMFDILVSGTGLLVFAPLMGVIALLIKITTRGPVFYLGWRVGQYGKPFRLFKFRTMILNADQLGGPSAADNDPRITRIGKVLRKYKIDELPQLINVLNGEMSIVGPRPEVPQYVKLFTVEERAILSVRPGITDWATLWNADEGTVLKGSLDPERTYCEMIRPQKIKLQLEYVRNQSFWKDAEIIMRTLGMIIFRHTPGAVQAIEEGRKA